MRWGAALKATGVIVGIPCFIFALFVVPYLGWIVFLSLFALVCGVGWKSFYDDFE